jgi:hypothetical protein
MDPNDTPMDSDSDKQQCPHYTNYLTRFLSIKKIQRKPQKTVPLYVAGAKHAVVKLH